jgi:hypothetical protein
MSPRSSLWIVFLLSGMIAVSLSCSGVNNPTLPALSEQRSVLGQCFGVFQIIPSEDMQSAEIVPIRVPQLDVTQYAEIDILEMQWDEVQRNWTLSVRVSNPTPFTGYGVRAIFTELGGKELRWPDGFEWLDLSGSGDERYPFFAVEKSTPGREFVGHHACERDITFHFPEGVDKWIPITFFIDANLGEPRPDPMVEDLDMSYYPPPCQHATVTAHIDDHQTDTGYLAVWIDLNLMGSGVEVMYDDGEHGDGLADDGIFGADFEGGTFGENYTLTVYARDPQGNTGENDIGYSPILYPPLPPITFETLFQGPFCLITEERLEVFSDQDSWLKFWDEFSPWDIPTPLYDFDKYRVIAVCLGEKPNDCYSVEINQVDWSSENCGWAVHYTETEPGENCECDEVLTSPFHLIKVNKAAFDIMFAGLTYEDPCTDPQDPCLDLIPVASGAYGTAIDRSTSVIMDKETWESWWAKSVGQGTAPEIDFETEMLFAVNMGVQNTSGYFATVDSACADDTDMLNITVGYHIPGENCMVLQVITYPYVVVSAKKTTLPYFWTTYEDVYDC